MTGTTDAATGRPDPPGGRWPFLTAHAGDRPVVGRWDTDDAALVALGDGGVQLIGVGEPSALAALLATAEVPAARRALLTRGTAALLEPAVVARLGLQLAPGLEWEWLVCETAPEPRPGEDRVERLAGVDEAAEVLDAGYPEREAYDDDTTRTWYGYRLPDGGLAGVLGARDDRYGRHLAAVTTHPEHRRRGVAAALTAVVTRAGLAEGRVAHLGIWSSNDGARRLYTALGYRISQDIETLRAAQ